MYQVEFYRRGLKTLIYTGPRIYVCLMSFYKLRSDKSITGYSLWHYSKRSEVWSNVYYRNVNNE